MWVDLFLYLLSDAFVKQCIPSKFILLNGIKNTIGKLYKRFTSEKVSSHPSFLDP